MEKKSFEKFNQLKNYVKRTEDLMSEVKKDMDQLQKEYMDGVTERVQQLGAEIDFDEFKDFLKEYWLVIKKDEYEYYVIVPDWLKFHVGTFARREGNYNIFIINKYTRMISGIPKILEDEIQLPEPKPYKVVDGILHFPPKDREEISKKFGYHIKDIGERQARIKQGHEFELIASLIRNGSLPFVPKQVVEEDLRPHIPGEKKIKLDGKYRFHRDAWETFLEYGAVGIYWLTGAGKDIISMYALDRVKVDGKPNLYLSPNLTILEQVRKEYIPQYAPRLKKELEKGDLILSTYQNYNNIKDKEYGLIVFSESHRLPADSYSRLSTLNCKYRIGQSASPFREDQRTDLIFAMTGKPIGLDWNAIMDLLGKQYHMVNVHIVPDMKAKYRRLQEIYNPEKWTLVFTWKIDKGKKIRDMLGIPFIYGETKNRIEKLRSHKQLVISKVGELGISLKHLQHIIEFDFLYGSRAGQLQKTGRLFHSEEAEQHDILFTEEEFTKYKKRLYSLIEKGFSLNWVDMRGDLEIGDKLTPVAFKGLKEKIEAATPIEIGNKVEFLKHPTVQQMIKDAVKSSSRVTPRYVKGILAVLLRNDETDYETVAKSLGIQESSDISKAASELERHGILKKRKDGGKVLVSLNTEGLREIIKLKREREETEKVIDSIFGEL